MSVLERLQEFQKRNYQQQLTRGVIRLGIWLLLATLMLVGLEFWLWFDSLTRSVIFYVFLLCTLYLAYRWVVQPIRSQQIKKRNNQTTHAAAKTVSDALPNVDDQLVNYLELHNQGKGKDELIQASLSQRGEWLNQFNFLEALDGKAVRRWAAYLAVSVFLLLLVAFVSPPVFTEGGKRLLLHRQEFIPPAPFRFDLLHPDLSIFKGDDLPLTVQLSGSSIPSKCTLVMDGQTKRMLPEADQSFKLLIPSVQEDFTFHFESAGYRSETFTVVVLSRPELELLRVELDYPDYTGLENQEVSNRGDIRAPFGTRATWTLSTAQADEVLALFNSDTLSAKRLDEHTFRLDRQLLQNEVYEFDLINSHAHNSEALAYRIDVLPDLAPQLYSEFIPDSAYFSYAVLAGVIKDDYGFTSLKLVVTQGNEVKRIPIDIQRGLKDQRFIFRWTAPESLKQGEELSFFLELRDNRPIESNLVVSPTYYLKKPNADELSESIIDKAELTDNQLVKSIEAYDAYNEDFKQLQDQLNTKQDIDWQTEKALNDQIEAKEQLAEMLNELTKQFKDLLKTSENFDQNEQLKNDTRELAELFEQLAEEQNSPLLEELERLLEEKNLSEISEKAQELSRNDQRRQRDLERARELLQRMMVQQSMQRNAQRLNELAKEQEDLSQNLSDNPADQSEQQEKINTSFEQISSELKEAFELNQEMRHPAPMEDVSNDSKSTNQELNDALEQMKQNNSKGAKQKQQRAAQRMKQMQQKLSNMSGSMQTEAMTENIDQLRNILDDLVKLSYAQEGIRTSFDETRSSDPKYLDLAQRQLVIKDDAAVIEDSLLSLAGRVAQLSSFITKEVDDVNYHMDNAIEEIRERRKPRAMMHQQFAMTSMNNLALLLNDVLSQMQMSMAQSMGNPSPGNQPNMPLPDLMQQQGQLSEQIQDLQGDQQSPRQLSEDLARMAAEQELIRRQLEKLREKLQGQLQDGSSGSGLNEAINLMEQNEEDLVNKRITRKLYERQKEITSRMLEAENAMREQEKDPNRRSETASDRFNDGLPNFDEYLRLREKEIELLRSVPLDLQPFYKDEVNEYFRRLSPDK